MLIFSRRFFLFLLLIVPVFLSPEVAALKCYKCGPDTGDTSEDCSGNFQAECDVSTDTANLAKALAKMFKETPISRQGSEGKDMITSCGIFGNGKVVAKNCVRNGKTFDVCVGEREILSCQCLTDLCNTDLNTLKQRTPPITLKELEDAVRPTPTPQPAAKSGSLAMNHVGSSEIVALVYLLVQLFGA